MSSPLGPEPEPEPGAGLVVVGGGPAALEAARAFREAGGRGPVTLLSAEDHPPYLRPALSKDYLSGETHDGDGLALEEESFFVENEIDLRLGSRVRRIDPQARRVELEGGTSLAYRTCVLAVGSRAVRPDLPGLTTDGVHLLRSRASAEGLRDRAFGARRAVVVGSGFIGCEAAATLAGRGVQVTLVSQEERPQQARLGGAVADRLSQWLTEDGVELRGGVEVRRIGQGPVVELADGSRLEADLVLVCVGAQPRTELTESLDVRRQDDRVLVDSSMRTSAADLLAGGDAVLAENEAAGRRLVVEHWGEAVRMGQIAGRTAAGVADRWSQAPGFWSEIGGRTLKYVAWGDGYDEQRLAEHPGGGFTVWFGQAGRTVGVLTHEADEDYEHGRELVEDGAPLPEA